MKKLFVLIIIAMILGGCGEPALKATIMPTVEKKQPVTTPAKRPVYYSEGDTSTYVIAFADKKEYKDFRKKFDNLFGQYSYDTLSSDTVKEYFRLILSGKAEPKDSTAESIDSIEIAGEKLPERFGIIKIYTGNGFYGEFVNLLTETSLSYLGSISITDSSDSTLKIDTIGEIGRIRIEPKTSRLFSVILDSTLVTSNGINISAFDLANSWNKLIKSKPATGRALFGNIKGVKALISGNEAVVQGFKIRDKNQIDVQMALVDTLFEKSFMNSKIFSALFNTGRYSVESKNSSVTSLMYNKNAKGGFALADQYDLYKSKDKNSLISFSQKKYDVVPFYEKRDYQYAKRLLKNGSHIEELDPQVCFLALGSKNIDERKYLKSIILPSRILNGAVMGDGIAYNEGDPVEKPESFMGRELKILYRSDLPIQVKTAKKIFADLKQVGIISKIVGLGTGSFERELVKMDYDIAVSLTDEQTIDIDSEDLFLGGKYFGASQTIEELIYEDMLYPLFSLKRWALCAPGVMIHNKKLNGFYRIKPAGEEVSIPEAE